MSAPTRTAWLPSTCGCGCRSAAATAPGCGCKQCQPGPGLDLLKHYSRRSRARTARIDSLLRKDSLTPEESEELDDLLYSILHG